MNSLRLELTGVFNTVKAPTDCELARSALSNFRKAPGVSTDTAVPVELWSVSSAVEQDHSQNRKRFRIRARTERGGISGLPRQQQQPGELHPSGESQELRL